MKRRFLSILLALTLSIGAVASLASCNGQGEGASTEGESTTVAETDGGEVTEPEDEDITKPEDESQNESETNPNEEDIVIGDDDLVYPNGDEVKGAGLKWHPEVFAGQDHTIDESKAVEKSAAEMLELLKNRDMMTGGEVYLVKEPIVLESDTKYYGNLAAIIAEGGIVIKDVSEIVIKELVVKGNVTVENSTGITFFKLDLKAGDVGVTVDEASKRVAFKSSKIYATDTAVKSDADATSFYQCYLSADKGAVLTGDDVIVQDTHVSAKALGISACGAYCTVRSCLVEANTDGIGIILREGSVNGIVTLCSVKQVQSSIVVSGGYNCVVLLNSAIKIIGDYNVNLYVVENKLGGTIELENNEYLLCNGNTFKEYDLSRSVKNKNNLFVNGDNLHDVNARVEYGANDEVLPHTNKDLFLEMERREFVTTDLSQYKSYNVNNYVRSMAKTDPFVIITPGAYNTNVAVRFDAAQSNTTLYAFGVYLEKPSKLQVIYINGASNVNIKGVTMGYSFQSAGQIHVLDKIGDNKLLTVTNAGYVDDYGRSDTENFDGSTSYMHKAGELMPWNNISGYYSIVNKNEDGTIVIQLTGKDAAKIYTSIDKGDIFSCRLSGDNSNTVYITASHGIHMEDCVIYGYSSALGVVANARSSDMSLLRMHNTAHSPYIISEETYNKYLELEQTYDVDLEISIDEKGRYRGGIPRIGSVDATHIQGATTGMDATSCIFEQMCDDGSNQRSSSARLAGYHDNGDGTTTVYFKGSVSETYWNIATNARRDSATPSSCTIPNKGERIYAYSSTGHILFDTVTLSAATRVTSSPLCHVAHVDKLVNSEIKEGDVTEINGSFTAPPKCTDGLCDVCGKVTHIDEFRDGRCDLCNAKVHDDWTKDGLCDVSGCDYKVDGLKDENGDGLNDEDGLAIIADRFYISQFNPSTGYYEATSGYAMEKWYKISYKTAIYEVLVATDSLDKRAMEVIGGMDLTDNDYRMDNKVLFDNLSANCIGFTFDNVLVQNKVARGILCKTHDATIKNCTFRAFTSSGVLMSVETTWGESTVPRNVIISNCLFDDTGRSHGVESNLGYSCIVISGLGATNGKPVDVTKESLPCKEISIIGNKFINTNNNYTISITAAQDILIKDNVFEARPEDTEKKYGKAIHINGAMDVEITGNTYSVFAEGDVTKAIVALNYKNLKGSDVEGVFPESKDPVVAQ